MLIIIPAIDKPFPSLFNYFDFLSPIIDNIKPTIDDIPHVNIPHKEHTKPAIACPFFLFSTFIPPLF